MFFIGIGGINMSSLALMTAQRGMRVAGSDRAKTSITADLEERGIGVFYEHNAENVRGFDAVIYTVAISEDNPEYQYAIRAGLPVISRADYLGYIMCAYKTRIGVCGMHGKSTTTSMLAQVFLDSGRDPTVMCGAQVGCIGGAYRLGGGEDFIFEACEYKDSFLDFYPGIAVILNIEPEHMDYFRDLDHIKSSFAAFASKCGADGAVVLNADDENAMDIARSCTSRLVTFGLSEGADVRAVNVKHAHGRASYELYAHGAFVQEVHLTSAGLHNVQNSLVSFAVASIVGIGYDEVSASLSTFKGVGRRMEFKGRLCGADVFDDYAHHPTEVRAALLGAHNMGYGRIVCVFQPHTYSRLYTFFDELVDALNIADLVIMADVYAAREANTFGVTSESVAKKLGDKGIYCASFEEIASSLCKMLKPADLLVVMGAGDIYKLFDLIID